MPFHVLQSLVNLKLALRVCAAFRGCYLDYKEKADAILRSQREKREEASLNGQEQLRSALSEFEAMSEPRTLTEEKLLEFYLSWSLATPDLSNSR